MDTDTPLCEGNYCSLKLYPKWKKKTVDHAFHLSKNELKHLKHNIVFSITKKPTLQIPLNKQTTGIMHGSHGIHNHFKKNLQADIRKINETDLEWIQSIKSVLNDLQKLSKAMHLKSSTNVLARRLLLTRSTQFEKNGRGWS
jgi:hypothetical protein